MIDNIFPVDELRSIAARKSKDHEFKSVHPDHVAKLESVGWQLWRSNKASVRMRRAKARNVLLEDRVWMLLYRMGFAHLSGSGGAFLTSSVAGEASAANQLDVVGLDQEIALAIECKSSEQPRRPSDFQRDLAKLSVLKQFFADAVHSAVPMEGHRRVPVLCFFTWNLILTRAERDRARTQQVVLFEERDLDYYEQLVAHLGPAAKYQFFADMLPGIKVKGLQLCVPALRGKMGDKHTCYTFAIQPEYLLKISYVSHRAKGQATDVDTYQRMINRARLRQIRKYIDENGMFPTNIVVSLAPGVARFEPQAHGESEEGAQYGLLRLRPAYRSAWIIDGQHRLFAYSGHPRAKSSHLSVLAFDDLPAAEQAQLFIDINHEQKSVKRGLLQELFAELHWNAVDEDVLVRAIASKAIQALDSDRDSPFCCRILLADDVRTDRRCISLGTLYGSLTKARMFIVKRGVEYGPLWAGDKLATLTRTVQIIKSWFSQICEGASEWWDLGAAPGGGLAMNDGVVSCVGVLRDVFESLGARGLRLVLLSDAEVVQAIRPYGVALGQHLGSLSSEQRDDFRAMRGIEGQTARRIACEEALSKVFPEFSPEGLKEAIEAKDANTRQRAFLILERVERKVHETVVGTLQQEFGLEDDLWWFEGVPERVRLKLGQRFEQDQGRKGPKEGYFDLLDFKDTASKNWPLFRDVLANGRGSKEQQLHWIEELNEIRKVVMHPSKNIPVTLNQLQRLEAVEHDLDVRLSLVDED